MTTHPTHQPVALPPLPSFAFHVHAYRDPDAYPPEELKFDIQDFAENYATAAVLMERERLGALLRECKSAVRDLVSMGRDYDRPPFVIAGTDLLARIREVLGEKT